MLHADVPLLFVTAAGAFGALRPGSMQTLSYTAVQWQGVGVLVAFVFYGTDELLAGYLVSGSRFLPRILGILLGLAGSARRRAVCVVAGYERDGRRGVGAVGVNGRACLPAAGERTGAPHASSRSARRFL